MNVSSSMSVIHVPFITYSSRLFVVVFQEMNCLHTFKYDIIRQSQTYISPPSFVFVSAAGSEIHELNRNKKEENSEIGYFQFNTFPGHIFNQRYLLSTCTH